MSEPVEGGGGAVVTISEWYLNLFERLGPMSASAIDRLVAMAGICPAESSANLVARLARMSSWDLALHGFYLHPTAEPL